MNKNLEVNKTLEINAGIEKVWDAITDPEKIKIYFFGTEVVTAWKVGNCIVFQGEFDGKKYKDKGNILSLIPMNLIQYNYWSGFSGLEDNIENYSIVTYHLREDQGHTILELTQKGFANDQALEHAQNGWEMVLKGMKDLVEKG